MLRLEATIACASTLMRLTFPEAFPQVHDATDSRLQVFVMMVVARDSHVRISPEHHVLPFICHPCHLDSNAFHVWTLQATCMWEIFSDLHHIGLWAASRKTCQPPIRLRSRQASCTARQP